MNFKLKILGALVLCGMISSPAMADVNFATAMRVGSFGYGADFDVGLTKSVNVRLGYNTFSLSRTINDTDVTYDGKFKIGAASAILDWHIFNGGFRLSAGAVQKGPKVDVVGKPAASGTFEFNGNTYQASDIGSANGTIKMGDSTAPYVGIGWGNTVDKEDRITFLLDLGAIHTGSPKVDLNFTCTSVIPGTCSTFSQDIAAEKADLEKKAKNYEWYPVINLGLAVRF